MAQFDDFIQFRIEKPVKRLFFEEYGGSRGASEALRMFVYRKIGAKEV